MSNNLKVRFQIFKNNNIAETLDYNLCKFDFHVPLDSDVTLVCELGYMVFFLISL